MKTMISVLCSVILGAGALGNVACSESPKQILHATPGTVKAGISKIQHGFHQGAATRKANRAHVKHQVKTQNPVSQAKRSNQKR